MREVSEAVQAYVNPAGLSGEFLVLAMRYVIFLILEWHGRIVL